MNETVLPPSPNWYLSKILVCSKRGTVAWGSKNNIVIAKRKQKDQEALEYFLIQDTHKDKVTSLAFCSKYEPDDPELLISSGDDDKIKVWDIDAIALMMKFSFNDEKLTMGVDWSIKSDKVAFAVNSKGFLLSCNVRYGTSKKISLGKLQPTCLACCPHESDLIAIGCKTGLVYIIDLSKKVFILYKLRGHDAEIVSLSWCPSDINVLRGDNKRDLLLASGSKDKSVFIWKAGGDGRCETVINLPKQVATGDIHKHKSKLSAAVGAWTAVCWAEPKVLLTNSVWGELLSWDLSTNNDKPVYQLFHTYHSRGLFCIATVPKHDVESNWRADSELAVWTLGQDRWIVCCRKRNSNPVELTHKIPTQGGYIYCIASCPIDTSCIAFGAGDMMLRLWNLSEPHVNIFDVTMLWQKIKGKIRTIAWNPECERSLAFATSEGRVGIFDVISNNSTLLRQYHRNTVYKVEWGSVRQKDKDISGLFSCAEGELVVYDVKNPDKAPISIIRERCTEFSWKADKLILAVAFENGSITFYDQDLKKCGNSIYIIKKTINCLTWHPESTTADTWTSPMKDYLAVASDSPNVIIFDVSDLRKRLQTQEETIDVTEDEDNNEQCNMHKIVVTLKGHSDRVVCLAWSPHFSGYLVSGSYDNVAQVWNIETQELMGTYGGHNAPILSCMWSPVKPQLIMTGSSDFMLRVWDYTLPTQSPKQSPVTKKKPKHKAQKQEKTNDSEAQSSTITYDPTSTVNQSPVNITEIVESKPPLIKNIPKKKDTKSYFITYGKTLNDTCNILKCIRSDIQKMQEEDCSELRNETTDNVATSIICEKENLLAMLANEKSAHINKCKHDTAIEIDMWCDNLKENLESAVKENHLTDFLVSLSANLSMKTWKEMCEAYAHQLIIQGNVEKAVSYLLCVHKIYEAIKAFLDAKMYKEAYILAKLKLDADDPVLAIVLQSWAQYATDSGQIEQAAHCYVKLGELAKAARILSRRRDLNCLEVASQLAFMTDDKEFGAFLAGEAITRALMTLDYSKARSIFTSIEQFQHHLKVHIDTHEAIMATYKKETLCNLMRMWLEGKSSHGVLQTLQDKYDISCYNALCHNPINITVENQVTMQLYISYQIAMAAICDIREIQLKHIATALSIVFQHETTDEKHSLKYIETNFFTYILAILDAKKPTDEDSIYAKSDYPISASIRAYLCSGLMNWLMTDLEQLSIEEEIQFTRLIEILLDDAFQQAAKDNVHRIDKIKQLERQLADLMVDKTDDNKDWMILAKELDVLKLDKKNFKEERICAPDPNLICNQAFDLSKILRDNTNRLQFLKTLDDKYIININNEIDS